MIIKRLPGITYGFLLLEVLMWSLLAAAFLDLPGGIRCVNEGLSAPIVDR